MFTNNMIAIMETAALSDGGNDCRSVTFPDGSTGYMYSNRGFLLYMGTGRCTTIPTGGASNESGAYCGVYFGTGSTPATKNDYTLDSPITKGLSIQNGGRLRKSNGSTHSYFAIYAVKNTTTSDINIYEIGLFSIVNASVNSSVSSNAKFYSVLTERTVLAEPIAIKPGETKLVTYEITFNQTLQMEEA